MLAQHKNGEPPYEVLVDYAVVPHTYGDFLKHWNKVPPWDEAAGTGVRRFYVLGGMKYFEDKAPGDKDALVYANADVSKQGEEVMNGGEVGVILDPMSSEPPHGFLPDSAYVDALLLAAIAAAIVVGYLMGRRTRDTVRPI